MNVSDYIFGQPITLRSPLRSDEAITRINEAVKSRWWPFHFDTVVGSAGRDKLTVRYVSSPFEYNAKPILIGRIEDRGGSSILDLNYRGPRSASAFFAVWYALLFIFIAVFLATGPGPGAAQEDRWLPYLLFPLMLLFPLPLHFIGTRNAESELQLLLDFLEETIQAR